jgi:predicted unusual protein kinase regulating ubiquinone biosynthesis (AarF/ABC1/UbiB family)
LTCEFIHGCKITEVEKIKNMGLNINKAAATMACLTIALLKNIIRFRGARTTRIKL